VLRQLKAEHHSTASPVVVFTASQHDIHCIEGYRLVANSHVMKPGESGKFMQVVGDSGNYWLNINHPPAH